MRALALFSGGLDSMLAIKLMTLQGIEVIAINMNIGFGSTKSKVDLMRTRAKMAGARFEVIDTREEYIQKILFDPKHGYGKHFNPCIDCHGFMFRTAKALLPHFDAQFIVTGEVIGQRPMSQRIEAINTVTKLAEDDDELILRPLCAKLMKETKPEREGWVDREKLLNISGRGRDRQIELAAEFGFDDYESPGGGCLLTLEAFSNKIGDFIKHDTFEVQDIDLLKFGRHLRLPDGAKLVIGRNQDDNDELEKIQNEKYSPIIILNDVPGPVSLLANNASEADTHLAIRLILAYAKTHKGQDYAVTFKNETITLSPAADKKEAHQYFVN